MQNLRKIRKEKGYTCETLGKIVGVQKSAMSKYERGEIQPSRDILIRLADTLDCTVDYLLGLTHTHDALNKSKEETKYEIGSEEWFRAGLAAHGITKLSDEQYKILIENMIFIAHKFNNSTEK